MIFVDTSYIWALIDKRDQLHSRAAAWQTVVTEGLVTTEYVLWEMLNGFSASADRQIAHAALDDIRTSSNGWKIVEASLELFDLGINLHRAHGDKDWSLTDCISFIVMRERGIQQALTHDHHFEQAGFDALLRRDPP